MLERTYATALQNALSQGTDAAKLVDGLVAHLKATGRMKLLPRIKKMLVEAQARSKKNSAVLEIARKEDEVSAIAEARLEGVEATEIKINDSLIRGWRVRDKGLLVDRSAKSSLIELYRHITN